jgi:hypothetical protein
MYQQDRRWVPHCQLDSTSQRDTRPCMPPRQELAMLRTAHWDTASARPCQWDSTRHADRCQCSSSVERGRWSMCQRHTECTPTRLRTSTGPRDTRTRWRSRSPRHMRGPRYTGPSKTRRSGQAGRTCPRDTGRCNWASLTLCDRRTGPRYTAHCSL